MRGYLSSKGKFLLLSSYYLRRLPLALVCVGVIIGVCLGNNFLWLGAFSVLAALWSRSTLFLSLGLLIGCASLQLSAQSLPKQEVQLTGVFTILQTFGQGSFQQSFVASGAEFRAYVSTAPTPIFQTGDVVDLKGVCEPISLDAAEGFEKYLLSLGVACISSSPVAGLIRIENVTLSLKRNIERTLTSYLHGDAQALIAGLLWGDDSAFSESTQTGFARAGVSHITAVSGGNIGLVAGLILWWAGVIPRPWAFRIAIIILLGYIGWIGLINYSALRATSTWILLILGFLSGAKPQALYCLLLVTAAILLSNPFIIYSIGFWLSVSATFAFISGFADPQISIQNQLASNLRTSTVAILATSPLIIIAFGSFSGLGLLINLVALPVAMLLTLIAAISLLVTSVGLPIAGICWFFTAQVADIFIKFVRMVTDLGVGYTEDTSIATVSYLALLACFIAYDFINYRKKHAA
jgi:ComEC/Rec2-related protein